MSEIYENTDEVLESNISEEIEFVETNAEIIESELISDFEEHLGETLYSGDERRIFLQGIAYVLADQLVHINETGRGNLLRYAINNQLDSLGELYQNPRLNAKFASVTIAFTISTIPTSTITIAKGTRITPDGKVFFATDEALIFNKGETQITKTVTATATESGANHNNFEIGQINKLVDGNQYVSSVSNITVSSGGSDIESDEEYRERLRLSPFSLSVAGPANSYKAIALSASADIGDVSVYSPSAGIVEIAVVKEGGEIPSEDDELLDQILEACSNKDRRPLTDFVKVIPAIGVDMNINVMYYVSNNETSKKEAIQNAVAEYEAWQVEKIGRAINPDKLNSLMFNAGAARVVVTSPSYMDLEENEIAKIGTVTVTYGGSITV